MLQIKCWKEHIITSLYKTKKKNITNDHSKSSLVLWYKMRKWEYFSKDKRKKEKK